MITQKSIAIFFFLIALVMGVVFYMNLNLPENLEGYFKRSYFGQFGALTIAVDLTVASYHLFRGAIRFHCSRTTAQNASKKALLILKTK